MALDASTTERDGAPLWHADVGRWEMETTQTDGFGTLLKRRRAAAGLTQEELAERAGVSARAVSDLERGVKHRPHAYTVGRLAKALRLSSEDRVTFESAARAFITVAPPMTPASVPAGATSEREGAPAAPFVGRARELALLERFLAREGAPLLLFAGEPGIGKSRLLAETAHRAVAYGWTVLRGGCQRRGGQEPYAPLVGTLGRYIDGRPPDGVRWAARGCAWLVRLLPELAGVPIEPLPSWTLTPDQERRLMFEAVGRFLSNVSGPVGTLLALDDLQWAGPDALDLLATIVRSSAAPLRVVGAYRDTEARPADPLSILLADLAHGGLVAHHSLGPLAPAEAALLLSSIGGTGEMGQDVEDRLLQRAGGVPFFLVSGAQALRVGSTDVVNADGVSWDMAQGIRQRVAVLTGDTRDMLGVAAVAGREITHTLLAVATSRSNRDVVAGLEEARRARLLEETEEGAYRFAHDVIREVVEADLGAARRALLHRDIAEALEQTPGWASAEIVAYHYARTSEHGKAAYWLEQAGDRAAEGFANAASLAHYTAAREHARVDPVAPPSMPALSSLDEKLGDLRLRMGGYAEAEQDFARARAGAIGPARRAELWRKEGEALMRRGDYARAIEMFAAAQAEAHGDEPGGSGPTLSIGAQAALQVSWSEVYYLRGEYEASKMVAEQAVSLLQEASPGRATDEAMANALYRLAAVEMNLGDDARAEGFCRRGLVLAERIGDQRRMAWIYNSLGVWSFRQGDIATANGRYRHSLALAERIGDQLGVVIFSSNVGEVALMRGDVAGAAAHYRRALTVARQTDFQEGIAWAWNGLGFVAAAHDALALARRRHRRALAIAERLGDRATIERAHHYLGRVALARGHVDEAEGHVRHALGIAEEMGFRIRVVNGCHWLGRTALTRGDLAGAESYGRRALTAWEQREAQLNSPDVWILLGEVAAERGDVAAAVVWCCRARRRARRNGMVEQEGRALLSQARALLLEDLTESRGSRLRVAAAALARARALVSASGLASFDVQVTLLTAMLRRRQGAYTEARTVAEEALRLALARGRQREEAQARRFLGECARSEGDIIAAEAHLRAALALETISGATLEVARTSLVLAETLRFSEHRHGEAMGLLREARERFAVSGAMGDLAQADRLDAEWTIHA